MQWQYRTLLFEFQKDGLLGDKYIDDEAVEELLNKQGARGWELVNVAMIQEGLLAFCKRAVDSDVSQQHQHVAPPQDAMPVSATSQDEPEPVSMAMLQQEEREHIEQLEITRRKTMEKISSDSVGGIKIS